MRVLADGDPQVSSILNTIISLGRTLNLQVTAEGVETHAELDCVRAEGCTEIQGYLTGRPLSAEDAARLLARAAHPSITPPRQEKTDGSWNEPACLLQP